MFSTLLVLWSLGGFFMFTLVLNKLKYQDIDESQPWVFTLMVVAAGPVVWVVFCAIYLLFVKNKGYFYDDK